MERGGEASVTDRHLSSATWISRGLVRLAPSATIDRLLSVVRSPTSEVWSIVYLGVYDDMMMHCYHSYVYRSVFHLL